MPSAVTRAIATLFFLVPLCASAGPAAAQTGVAPPAAGAHMSFSPVRPATAADTARALAVADELRNAIARYPTLEEAQAAGYRSRRDAESVKEGRLLHVGLKSGHGARQQPFDAAAPRALLYRRQADGQMLLAGAMFVAPVSATDDDLDAIIPLGVARWHRHMDVCVSSDRGSSRRFPKATTQQACEAAGGRFRAESRYMIHVMTDAGNDLSRIFPQGQVEMPGMDMGPGHEH